MPEDTFKMTVDLNGDDLRISMSADCSGVSVFAAFKGIADRFVEMICSISTSNQGEAKEALKKLIDTDEEIIKEVIE